MVVRHNGCRNQDTGDRFQDTDPARIPPGAFGRSKGFDCCERQVFRLDPVLPESCIPNPDTCSCLML